jgi:hypothetical protein
MLVVNETASNSGLVVLLKASYMGAARAVLGLPFEHPFDTIKTNMQALSKESGATISDIYASKGIAGFYSGFLINTVRVLSKQIYRWPLMIGLSTYYQSSWNMTELNSSTITGLTMAMI